MSSVVAGEADTASRLWVCKRCTARLAFSVAEPGMDSQGYFFVCPDCSHRNVLSEVAMGTVGNAIEIAQLDS